MGADCKETRFTAEGLNEPVIDEPHRNAMIHDLYCAGWSYRLIAQLIGRDAEYVFGVLTSPEGYYGG